MFSADVRQMIDRYFYLVVLILTSVRKLESFSKVTDDLLFTFSIQSLQHAHHPQILGGWGFDSLHRTIEIEGEAGGKGVADFLRHQHVPLAFCVVTICQYNIVFWRM